MTLAPFNITKFTLFASMFWILASSISLVWNIFDNERERRELAFQVARSFFGQLVIERSWNADHGGVYVPVSKKVQPNPYLKDPYRDLTTKEGIKLTKVNPAFMSRQIAEMAAKEQGIQFHVTSLTPLRPENKADQWEKERLKSFKKGEHEYGEFFQSDGKTLFRYMAPLYIKENCIGCHAEQGYKIGETGGGIGITLPFGIDRWNWVIWISHFAAALAGLAGIIFSGFLLEKSRKKLIVINENLEKSMRIQRLKSEELQLSKAIITKKKGQMEEDLKLAGEVQRSILSSNVDIPFLDIEIIYQPVGEVSGDVYDFFCNGKDAVNVFLGDATGHGVAAAFMTVMVQIGVDTIEKTASVTEYISQLNSLLSFRETGKFVTGIFTRINSSGLLTTTNAGHPPLIIFPKKGGAVIFREGGLPLGASGDVLVPYTEQTYQLQPGDKIIAYTDGVTEWSNKNGDYFGLSRMLDFIHENKSYNLKTLLSKLLENIRQFSQGKPCEDDLTILGFEYREEGK